MFPMVEPLPSPAIAPPWLLTSRLLVCHAPIIAPTDDRDFSLLARSPIWSSGLQAQRDLLKAIERRFQVLDDLGGDLVGRRQQIGVVQRVILEPEDVEVHLVARDKVGMG